jgi:beta-lactamase regulating signal transducer with metallopeptidase domain
LASEPARAPAPKTAPTSANEVKTATSQGITAQFGISWLSYILIAWAGGVVLTLSAILNSGLRLRRLSRQGCALLDAEWELLLRELCEELRIHLPVMLLKSEENLMPMTWGWWRPVVMMPTEADQWPAERRRLVMQHELGHVKRWDWLTQWISRIICAFYWFNPLVWLAARRMCVERERACDDLVLSDGWKPSEYASQLIEIAARFRRVPQVAAIAMARSSGLEERVTAILDCRRKRGTIGKLAVVLIGSAVFSLEFLMGGCATVSPSRPWSLERSKVGDQLKRFVAEKQAQAEAAAEAKREEMLPEFKAIFAAAAQGDWQTMSNIFELNLAPSAPQYTGPGTKTVKDMRFTGTQWQAVMETVWAFVAFGSGDFGNGWNGRGEEDYSIAFGNGIIKNLSVNNI